MLTVYYEPSVRVFAEHPEGLGSRNILGKPSWLSLQFVLISQIGLQRQDVPCVKRLAIRSLDGEGSDLVSCEGSGILATGANGKGREVSMRLTCESPVFWLIEVMPKEGIDLVRV